MLNRKKLEMLKYTWAHKKAFLKVEKKLYGRVSLRGLIHDMDKVLMFIFSNKTEKEIQTKHRSTQRHHDNDKVKTPKDYREMIVDWECARITKPDKPLDAYETLLKFYPHLKDKIMPFFEEVGLNK